MVSIEGVHFLFDRYAFLNAIMKDGGHDNRVDQHSSTDELKEVIKLARSLHHTDKLTRSGQAAQERAKAANHQIEDVGRILLDPVRREAFHAKLEKFRAEKPEYISENGEPILIVGDQYFNLDDLLKDDVSDTSTREKAALSQSGYNPDIFAAVKGLYEMDPTEGNKKLRVHTLNAKLTYLTALEGVGWARLGVQCYKSSSDVTVIEAGSYVEVTDQSLQQHRDDFVLPDIKTRCDDLRIGYTQSTPLLLSFAQAAFHPEGALNPMVIDDIEGKLIERAEKNFEDRAQFLKDIAQQKQEILSDLVQLTDTSVLRKDQSSDIHYIYLAFNDDNGGVIAGVALNVTTGDVVTEQVLYDIKVTKDHVLELHEEGTVHLLIHNDNISEFWAEISAACHRVFDEYQTFKPQGQVQERHPTEP